MTSSNCVFGFDQIVVLRGEELVALLGFFVFLDGDEIDRPHFIDPLLQRADLFADRVPIGRRAVRRHFFGRERFDLGADLRPRK